MATNNNVNKGLGFFTILGLIFITLKLCNVINWSWWLVLLPLYGGILLWAIVFGGVVSFGLFLLLIGALCSKLDKLKK